MNRPSRKITRRRRTGILAIGLLAAALFSGAPARATETKTDDKFDRAFLVRFGNDFKEVVCSPAHWDGGNLLTFAAVSGTGLLLFAFDQDIQDWAQGRRTSGSDKASAFFSALGNGATLAGLIAGIYVAGEIANDGGWRRTALLSLESLVGSSILVWTLKFAIGRARPYADESSRSFHPFALKNSYWSLPAGHAVASFAVATVIAEQTESPLVDVLAYSLATLVGISRIQENKHWASDVFLGSAIGYFVAKKICNLNSGKDESGIRLGLDFARGRRALTLSLTF